MAGTELPFSKLTWLLGVDGDSANIDEANCCVPSGESAGLVL